MELGFVSAILGEYSFEEMIDTASDMGYQCVEVACWPVGKAARRYAGVTHIDIENLDHEKIEHIKNYCKQKNVSISALGYYPNMLDRNLEQRTIAIEHLKNMIKIAPQLEVDTVSTFIGRISEKSVEENLEEVAKVWPEILKVAEEYQVKIAIENCPMLFGVEQWPGGQNLFTTPSLWRKIFNILPSDHLGINYDPSHFIWQHIDYLKPLYEFKEKIFHVHFKDIKLYKDQLDEVGTMGYPLDFMAPKLPGLGDVEWGKFVSALKDINYDSYACIEVEDRAFEDSRESILKSLKLSKKYMSQYVI